tara:strand:- start:7 stop:237 length:231 start_codon:yes stop_codon:yes gene_type:complete
VIVVLVAVEYPQRKLRSPDARFVCNSIPSEKMAGIVIAASVVVVRMRWRSMMVCDDVVSSAYTATLFDLKDKLNSI